ncbi:MAG: 30S ribosome-binding factor RbfA [Lachnospiraceae bacterium]|jgi:ribosome-binding factor A
MKKNSRKYSRLNQEIRKELSNIIRNEMKDPRIGLITSVTDVEVTTDLKECRVFISVLGDEDVKKETLNALNKGKGFLRYNLAKKMNLRNTPELTFAEDNSIERGMYMDSIMDSLTYGDDSYDI